MDRNTMKNTMKSLKLWVLGCVMLFAGVQNASAALAGCEGTVYLKLPDGWTTAYTVAGGQFIAFKKSTEYSGWFEISTNSIGGTNNADEFFISSKLNDYGQAPAITPTVIGSGIQFATGTGFSCSDVGKNSKELWIQPYPGEPTKTYTKDEPPDVKYFYMFLPNNEKWKSAVPMLREDGVDYEMSIDPEHCGWYFRRYIDVAPPSEVLIRRDDDELMEDALGMNGEWEVSADPQPIPLNDLFTGFAMDPNYDHAIYFVADATVAEDNYSDTKGWFVERPAEAVGTCSYPLAALIYDTDASLHGAFTCNPDWSPGQTTAQAHANACYYPGVNFPVVNAADGEVPCIGVHQGMVQDSLVVENGRRVMKLTAKGRKCFGAKPDEAFAAMFNYTPGINEKYCYNMTFTQAADGKYEFDSDNYQSPGATVPGGFYPAEEPPLDMGMISTDKPVMLSERLAAAETKRKAEGPVFFCADYNNQKTKTPEGLRTIHPTEGVPMSDLICNGPGWDGGVDCEELFAAGSEFYKDGALTAIGSQISKKLDVTWEGDGWGWACEQMAPIGWNFYKDKTETSVGKLEVKNQKPNGSARWTSGSDDSVPLATAGRNQHFCFESHATFRYKHGLKFSFRGDDDIWVFINHKLAVDLGGTHLAAPGYVDLDKFMPNGVVGNSYPIHIFFCDRRTTMSNVHIKTNMFIEQTSGIKPSERSDMKAWRENGINKVLLSYTETSDGSCAAEVNPDGKSLELEGEEISEAARNGTLVVTYVLTKDPANQDAGAVVVSAEEFAQNPKQFGGFVDVSSAGIPQFTPDSLRNYLKTGKYYLWVKIGNSSRKIATITVKGAVNVADRNAVFVDEDGRRSLEYKFVNTKMASSLKEDGTPDVNQMIPLYIASITDPCSASDPNCVDPLEMSASQEKYSVTVSNSKAILYEMKNGVLTEFKAGADRSVTSDLDTIYVTIPFGAMDALVENVTVSVTGGTRKANLKFFIPELAFVKSETTYDRITQDDSSYVRLKGMAYDFYIVALDANKAPCGALCDNIGKIGAGNGTSPGIDIIAGGEMKDGRASVQIRSMKVYERGGENGTATFCVTGPSKNLMKTCYTNMQFQEPPVPTPQFADIFDIYGEPGKDLNIQPPYFVPGGDYLDGIGDSLVIYYHREFNQDSLPEKIAVFWEDDKKDSVVFDKTVIKNGAACGIAKGASADSLCLSRIIISGKDVKLSKKAKTSGVGKLKSWATYCPRRKDDGTCAVAAVTQDYEGVIYDRIAPIILAARAITDKSETIAQLKIEFSEDVQKTDAGELNGDNVFSYYINNTKEAQFVESLPLLRGVAFGKSLSTNKTLTLQFDKSSLFPQSGDYIHFRGISGIGLVEDKAYEDYKVFNSMRDSLCVVWGTCSAVGWNTAPGFDATDRVPSPWAMISGDVNTYVVRLIPSAKGGIPEGYTDATALDPVEVITFDAFKDTTDFKEAIKDKNASLNAAFSKYGFLPHGWYAKVDMGALIESKEEYASQVSVSDVYFDYEMQLFTNLGSHVLTQHGRIYCDDKINEKENHKSYFDGTNCVENRKDFYILWNLKGDVKRLVGTGAYVSKFNSFVKLGKFGKKVPVEKSEMWGVRHNAKVKGTYNPKK